MLPLRLLVAGCIVGRIAAFCRQPSFFIAQHVSSSYPQPKQGVLLQSSSSSNHDDDATSNNGWSVADDWSSLSWENPLNSVPDSRSIFNQDIAYNAAQSMVTDDDTPVTASPEDVWLEDVIQDILQNPLSSTPLYDTGLEEDGTKSQPIVTTTVTEPSSLNKQQQKAFEEKMADEIALLVRCNESPEHMLVRAGRALAPLTQEQKHDIAQLVVWNATKNHWEATPFFLDAIATIFHQHAIQSKPSSKEEKTTSQDDNNEGYMDARAISRWMTKSLGNEIAESNTEQQSKNYKRAKDMVSSFRNPQTVSSIGPHDGRVLKLLSKYSNYGTGKLTLENFQRLYLEAITLDKHGNQLAEQALEWHNADHIRQVWRDLTNHGIVGPTEQEWNQQHLQLQQQFGTLQQQTQQLLGKNSLVIGEEDFMDECEILDYSDYEPPPTEQQIQSGHDAKNDKFIRKSSYEKVRLASDGKTPLYMEEGDFVFIDEESCIGCMQCVNAAPASFLMLENGRARTFHQRHGPDVRQGVAACPVNCMHFVSFEELKELETVRDKGDGRDDHRHMGHRRGHTPLHVAGMDSDNNHRSSWYHHIKNKCCSSGQCPSRGCFDCPSFSEPGGNPHFQKKAKEAQHVRATHFIDHGDVDLWRKTADL